MAASPTVATVGDRGDSLVLVVDDDEDIRTSCAECLRSAGFEVIEAADGILALEAIRARRPAAIVLDVSMPVLDGFAVLDLLDDPPPVVLVTAQDHGDKLKKRREKVKSLAMKPLRPEALIELVSHAMLAGP